MDKKENLAFEPFFMASSRGNLFCVYFPPAGDAVGNLLYIPPFAEEMNRCRSMAAMQARDLAAIGIGTLIIDLYGTGDSAGDFSGANWDIWSHDVLSGVEWLNNKKGEFLGFLGVRLGTILAAELISKQAVSAKHLIAWQPVTNAKNMFTQFLRIRIAANMDTENKKETTSAMRQQFADRQSVEIGGYEINPEMAADLDARNLIDFFTFKDTRIQWFEMVSDSNQSLGLASKKVIEQSEKLGMDIHSKAITGPMFWQLHERCLAAQLIESTTAIFSGSHDD